MASPSAFGWYILLKTVLEVNDIKGGLYPIGFEPESKVKMNH